MSVLASAIRPLMAQPADTQRKTKHTSVHMFMWLFRLAPKIHPILTLVVPRHYDYIAKLAFLQTHRNLPRLPVRIRSLCAVPEQTVRRWADGGHVTDVGVDLYDLLDAAGLHQGRGDSLLHSETHSFRRLDADGCRAQLRETAGGKWDPSQQRLCQSSGLLSNIYASLLGLISHWCWSGFFYYLEATRLLNPPRRQGFCHCVIATRYILSVPWWLRWHTPLEIVFLPERKCSRLCRERETAGQDTDSHRTVKRGGTMRSRRSVSQSDPGAVTQGEGRYPGAEGLFRLLQRKSCVLKETCIKKKKKTYRNILDIGSISFIKLNTRYLGLTFTKYWFCIVY